MRRDGDGTAPRAGSREAARVEKRNATDRPTGRTVRPGGASKPPGAITGRVDRTTARWGRASDPPVSVRTGRVRLRVASLWRLLTDQVEIGKVLVLSFFLHFHCLLGRHGWLNGLRPTGYGGAACEDVSKARVWVRPPANR